MLAILLAGDAATTWVAIGEIGVAVEGNPLIRELVSSFGKQFLVLSRFVVAGGGALLWKISEGERKYLIPLGPSLVMGVVVGLNILALLWM